MSSLPTAWLGLLAALLAAPLAAAQAPERALPDSAALRNTAALAAAAPSAARPAPQRDVAGFGMAVPLDVLEQARGGSDGSEVLNDTTLTGTVHNNTAINVVSGGNRIESSSFANMSGIPIVIQNTGANVLIQNATVINLQFK